MPVTTNTEDIRWFERQVDRLARRLTQAQFTELLGRPVDRSRWGPARIALVGIAVVLLAAIVASAGFGLSLSCITFRALRRCRGCSS